MAFDIQPRQSLIVYTYSLKQTRQLKRYGTVMYVSKKMRYVVLYVDQKDIDELTQKLQRLRFVKRVVPSMRPQINETFNGVTNPVEDAEAKDDEG
ncbi:YlbG family protein [Levilactobacillus zymae]|uniref:YlbG family protein n=1 Tax=Levilactobacillus zymae TaxID=267363 RepID=UPI0028BA25A3|nr:YlbG family protein [Levilactobacillus zymae]MDT6980406.1 YlbG family protein [Levilactobacillus zymae]